MSKRLDNEKSPKSDHSFASGGETGNLILKYDWASSRLGAIDQWPQSLRTTLDIILHSAFPMFLFWGDELICFYNDAYRPSLGSNGKHPAIGHKAHDVWPEIWDSIYPLITQVLTTGQPAWFEDRLIPIIRNNNLEDVYWTFSYSPAYGDDGGIAGVVVTCMETTLSVISRKNIEETVKKRTDELVTAHSDLEELNRFFQNIIDITKEPLQVLKPVMQDGKIVDFTFRFTNTAYAAYANAKPSEIQDKKVGDIFPGYFQTSSFTNVVEAFMTGVPNTWEIHYDVDGLDLHNRMSAVKMDEFAVVHFSDFTELKNLQNELLKKITQLERSNRDLEDFAHVLSHDLKEPVRKIKVFLERLRTALNTALGEQSSAILEKIENSALRMEELIEDILTFSSVSRDAIVKEHVDLRENIAKAIDNLEVEIQDKNASVIIGELPTVQGQPTQLQQMFQNLIANGLKYSRKGITPVINISSSDSSVDGVAFNRIEITDNGIGFDPRYTEEIFKMFKRLHGRNEYSGSGIGLSIVKKVVDNHNGKIETNSTPGEGSTFNIYLPK